MLTKYVEGASKVMYNIYTGDESWFYAYEQETKHKSIVCVFQDKRNPTKLVGARSISKQMVACFFGIAVHKVTVALD
ncbi:HTH_48 domain-containing protein [Trichonephila clavata]|uniref:HTH_48 domain-containing protein n=1 Tax=Trichonephila clavata TaxID=2740835 RepID=A0A8X6G4Y1_TRICU|nr:HTH_48 domain-containing protein [Trichonephila clavata]